MMTMFRRLPFQIVFALIAVLSAGSALAVVAPQSNDPLLARVLSPAGFVATPVPEDLAQLQGVLDSATVAQIAAFKTAAGPDWSFYIDRRSGAMAMVKGQGIPWTSGAPSIASMSQKALALIAAYPALFQVPVSELVLDERGSLSFGENNQYSAIVFNQVINGVPVDHSRIGFYVSHGNMVMFGVDRVVPSSMTAVRSTVAVISAAHARTALAAYVGGLSGADVFREDGRLAWTLRGTNDAIADGPIGTGWTAHLTYQFVLSRNGGRSNWEALISAIDGRVLRFADANDYLSVVKASVHPVSGCSDPANCSLAPNATSGPGTATERTVTLPYARLNFAGGTCAGDGCFSNAAGAFSYPAGATSAVTTLDGKYFTINDTCGVTAAAGVGPNGNIDLGTSNPAPYPQNTDCVPGNRQSAPDSAPTFAGPGNTHSARGTFYHLNLINIKSRFYLPTNAWLKGVDGPEGAVRVNTNIKADALALVCNAYWDGSTLNFFRVTEPLFCNNTGELPSVFLHEYGHGLDQNDGSGTAPEGGTGEAMGDMFALLESQQSCVGTGFRLVNPTGNFWSNKAGYGSTTNGGDSRNCSGVRDLDYRNLCSHNTTDCVVRRDADAPNGSRTTSDQPNYAADRGTDPEGGTPARHNHMTGSFSGTTWVPEPNSMTPNNRSNFYICGAPNASCAGPLGFECHCESMIASQAAFDLTKLFIERDFGGDMYAQGPKEVSGWQYMDRLWYLTRDTAVSGYTATGPNGTTNGCGATNWYQQFLLVDDDNGNLADGTPHGDILFKAFDRHAIACGSVSSPQNQATGHLTPPPAVDLTACDTTAPVQLSWTSSPGATKYRVLRNTLGCSFGFAPIATLDAGQRYFEDTEVAPGVPFYYSVQPVGLNDSSYGFASNCLTVTPTTCTSSQAAPSGVTASASGPNQITVSWAAAPGAVTYKILRKDTSCAGAAAYRAIGVVAAALTTFIDTTVIGTREYAYHVVASSTACASCTSVPSNCASAVASGTCLLPPSFAGVRKVTADTACNLTVTWTPATAACAGASFTYSIYRSTISNFIPQPANLIASGITGTEYVDQPATAGARYFYLVRATDSYGNSDSNLVRKYEVASSALTSTTFLDTATDGTTAQRHVSVPIKGDAQWAILASDGVANPTKVYKSQATNFYGLGVCQSLQSDTIAVGANPALTFRTRVAFQPGLVGGIVQVATEAGDYQNWTKLTTINYSGVMGGQTGPPPCNDPGLGNGQPAFTSPSANVHSTVWLNISGSLSAFANQKIRLRFLSSTEYGQALVFQGWYLDDIAVSDSQVPGSCGTPVLAFSAASSLVNEAAGTATISVSRTGSGGGPVSVTYTTTDGSATAGSDYTTRTGTLTWSDLDVANKTFTVPILNDTDVEGDETVNLTLSDPTGGAVLGPLSTATLIIRDNDGVAQPGTLQFSDPTYSVSEAGPVATISVTRTGGNTGEVGVTYATSSGGTASSNEDYVAESGTLGWADGDTTPKSFTVAINDDAAVEGNETVNLSLTNVTGGALLGTASAVLTIIDNDASAGTVQFDSLDYSVNEGAGQATITVTRTGGSTGVVGVSYTTADGTATVASGDYTAASGTLAWADGDVAPKTFTVAISDDGAIEGSENFTVVLSAATGGASVGSPDTATVTIVDNDSAPVGTLQFSSATYTVAESGPAATITVTRTGGSTGAVGVTYATSNGTATAADYTAASGTLSWADGDSASKTFTVAITEDTEVEGSETVNLTLSAPTGGATLGAPAAATLTITDNDVAPAGTLQFNASSYGVGEADGTATITVTRTGGSAGAVGVSYATSNGTANGSDYTTAIGSLSWANGDTAPKSFTVSITNDTAAENSETINLALTAPTGGASLGSPNTAVLTIVDDDTAPAGTLQFSASTYSVNEADAIATISVTRTGGSSGAVSVNYATSNGSAIAGSDYTAAAGTLSWASGDTATKTFSVTITNDSFAESNETVNLGLGAPTGGATVGSPSTAVLTIVDDEAALTLTSISPNSVCQGRPDFTIGVNGTGFSPDARVRVNGSPRSTTFETSTRLMATIPAADVASAGTLSITVINGDNSTSNAVTLTVTADSTAPTVASPASITVLQSTCTANGDGADGNTSPALATFLAGGSATDVCTQSPTRLSPQVNGSDANNSTLFRSGTTLVTFRFRDNAGNIGTATSNVTVRLYGDLNSDHAVDAVDLNLMANYLVGNNTIPLDVADLNRDGEVDSVDHVILANFLVDNIDCLPY